MVNHKKEQLEKKIVAVKLKNPINNAAQASYKAEDIGEYEVLKEDRDFELVPRYYRGNDDEAIFSHFLLSFKGKPVIEQPEECIYGYGTCCYPIEECHDCPNRREGEY